ncbi:hypothetical protein RND81_09G065900 [Saponaria officinalis]|uniref:Uncharacterized protein n=1 Tax=Saponaria officinalis TaxID=3572 RepID=A0AAW1IHQ3_SAPOF
MFLLRVSGRTPSAPGGFACMNIPSAWDWDSLSSINSKLFDFFINSPAVNRSPMHGRSCCLFAYWTLSMGLIWIYMTCCACMLAGRWVTVMLHSGSLTARLAVFLSLQR